MKSHHSKQGPSQRQLKVGEAIRHALAEIFMREELYHPDVKTNMITVSEVRISPDLKNAKAYVMPLGGQNQANVMEYLKEVTQQLRTMVNKKVHLKFSPSLIFVLDDSYEEANKIAKILSREDVAKDLKNA